MVNITNQNNKGFIKAISISSVKGIPKSNVDFAYLKENYGIEGDAHAGEWHRQISLLSIESIDKMIQKGLINLVPGIFAENITTSGIDILQVEVGNKIKIGNSVKLEITQIGKECLTKCAIYEAAGDCIMPKEGVFAKVIQGGEIRVNDYIELNEE
ncbi:MAG: MOSC domain-containing protein [FCB group bacterium]